MMRTRVRGGVVLALVVLCVAGAEARAAVAQDVTDPAAAQGVPTPAATVEGWTLDRVMGRALEVNREIREARFGLEAAGARATEAWSAVFPRLDLVGSYTRNLAPPVAYLPRILFDGEADDEELVPVPFGADNVWDATLSLEQTLFDARAFIGVGAASRFRALEEERARGTAQRILTELRILYFDLLVAQERTALLERSVDRVRRTLEQTRALAEEGLASEYDALRLEVELANLEPRLEAAVNRMRAGERALRTELELDPDEPIELAGSLARMDLGEVAGNPAENRAILEHFGVGVPAQEDAAAVEALRARVRSGASMLRQLELDEELRSAELRAERSTYLPRLSLFGNYRVQAQQDGSPEFFGSSPLRAYERLVGVRVSLPVFTGRARSARIQQRSAELAQATIRRDRVGDEVDDQLRTLLEGIQEARVTARGQALARDRAEQGFRIASAQFQEGLMSRLELVDAEVALRQAELNYAEAVHSYLTQRARLDELAGAVPIP